ncbi:MAG: alpha/beta hydrolase [Muribaculaceae bacterium]|nr:alpha/beta hydrolase [Muribaculaceae bacterium]
MKKIRLHIVLALCVGTAVCSLSLSAGTPVAASSVIEQELNPQNYKGEKLIVSDDTWHSDILGDGYEARTIKLQDSFDGPVCCTVIRRTSPQPSGKAVLYVHGFNDYFFQSEMGKLFNDSSINFYAVDLRRYGRSLRPWQYPFDVRNVEEYFEDIDAAMSIIQRDGNTDITLSGHSTGGLTVLTYAANRGARVPVRRVVTDSPFLQWNFSSLYRNLLLPAVSAFGAISPATKIDQGHCDAYAESLLKQYHGEWEYNTDWKMVFSPPVKAGWIRAISRAQSYLMKHAANIYVPTLIMHSSRKLHTCMWQEDCQISDVVLNPKQIAERGRKMGPKATVATIDDGMHDLILSEPSVRAAAYDTIFNFIRNNP